MNATRTIAASIALATAMGAAFTASAGTVHDSVSKSDPRYMTTGCRFAGAFPSGAGSIGIWIKNVTDYATTASVFGSCHVNTTTSNDQGLLLFINSSGNFGFRVAGSKDGAVARQVITAAGTSSLLNDGNWHFLLGTFDKTSGKMDFYIDGESAGSADINIDSLVSDRCFAAAAIGKKDESTTYQKENSPTFTGLYAEATLWNKALTAAEVVALHTRRAYPWEDGLIGYWPLSDGRNLAQGAVKRADDSRPDALFYVSRTVDDADFFDNPPSLFVASEEWVEANGYVQPAAATFTTPDDPATNVADAVSAEVVGNAIFLIPGTHSITSHIDITTANLTITGRYCGSDVGEAVVDAQGLSRHFRSDKDYSGADGWVFDGLTFANGSTDNGGSLYLKSNTGIVRNCVFRDNLATASGGAIYSYTAKDSVISNCLFYGNSAANFGGAVYLSQNAESTSDFQRFVDCVFSNNEVTAASGNRYGGGVYCNRKVELENCLFVNNTGLGHGSHAYVGINTDMKGCVFTGSCNAKNGSCLWINKNPVTVSNCVFRSMTCQGTSSSFISFNNSGTGSAFVDCVFTNNANQTSLFSQNSKNLLFRQCLIADNASGQPVLNNVAGSVVFENCTIAQALFHPSTVSAAATNTLVNCILPNATVASSGSYCNILSNCLVKAAQNGPFDSGVITGNPRFTDAANGDYTLMPGSPCREKGLTLSWMAKGSTDLLGNPRVVDRNTVAFSPSALPDLGCYEIQERSPGFVMSFR